MSSKERKEPKFAVRTHATPDQALAELGPPPDMMKRQLLFDSLQKVIVSLPSGATGGGATGEWPARRPSSSLAHGATAL
jgi:hypothetical protein